MKKMLLAFLSIPLIFTLSACKAETTPTKAVGNKYVAEKAELKGLPVYPDARLVYDQESSWGDEDSSYWGWIYVTTASANEILDFFEKEFSNLGYKMTEKTTHGSIFFIRDEDNYIYIDNITWDKENTAKLPDEVTPETPGREYRIQVNLDKWKKK